MADSDIPNEALRLPADVIGLIRQRRLGTDFARRLDKSLRAEFRKLAKAVAAER